MGARDRKDSCGKSGDIGAADSDVIVLSTSQEETKAQTGSSRRKSRAPVCLTLKASLKSVELVSKGPRVEVSPSISGYRVIVNHSPG